MTPCRIAVCLVTLFASTGFADDQAGLEFFEAKIRPVLVQQCYECHSAESKPLQGNLRVDNREALRKGFEAPVEPTGPTQSYQTPPCGAMSPGWLANSWQKATASITSCVSW